MGYSVFQMSPHFYFPFFLHQPEQDESKLNEKGFFFHLPRNQVFFILSALLETLFVYIHNSYIVGNHSEVYLCVLRLLGNITS